MIKITYKTGVFLSEDITITHYLEEPKYEKPRNSTNIASASIVKTHNSVK
jgi:hypothetical protein